MAWQCTVENDNWDRPVRCPGCGSVLTVPPTTSSLLAECLVAEIEALKAELRRKEKEIAAWRKTPPASPPEKG